ncbi:serine protease [Xanthobacter autotrophicus]|uniref:serine protease n=1 Tax=Xanthobacter TaxID=279 RepID=UPI0024AABBC3|nr:serine protease [Xanthobacter autotrophicus]MDI4662750.1 serine protease [Xanthobacter autotrophicus]
MMLQLLRPVVQRPTLRFVALAVCLSATASAAQAQAPGDELRLEQAPAAAGARPSTLPASDDIGTADRPFRPGSNAKTLPYAAAGAALKTGGILKKGANEKIVGGQQAAPGSYPFQAGIIRVTSTNGKITGLAPMCGGSVLTSRWILSAAHCFVEGEGGKVEGLRNTKNLLVHVGNTSLLAEDDERDWIPIKRIIPHPKYVTGTNVNDIALIELERAPKRNVKVAQVTVTTLDSESADLPSEAELHIIGWGTTSEGGSPSPDLLETKLNAVDRNQCNRVLTSALVNSPDARKAIENLSYVFNLSPAGRRALEQQLPQIGGVVTPQMFCAGAAVDGIDTCQGDSGGPILSRKANGSFVQVGIVSFGIGCGHAELPGVYTRLALYTDWMKKTIATPPAPPPAAAATQAPAKPQKRP